MGISEWEQCSARLGHADQGERLEAMRQLSRMADPAAGPDLLRHLKEELAGSAEWVCLHGLIQALGACAHRPALELLQRLLTRQGLGQEVEEALGQAVVRLSVQHPSDAGPVLQLIKSDQLGHVQGALQAMARLRMVPEQACQTIFVDFALGLDLAQQAWSLIWILRASAGWSGEPKGRLLERYGRPEYAQLRQVHLAVESARKGEYKDWAQF